MARRKKQHFDKCFSETGHHKDCRPARPLCRWMRRKRANRRKCECGGYHFPHRAGSGCCVLNPERVGCNGSATQGQAGKLEK
jgi:hypothetical protein